jgi:hypothetical protein
VLRRSSGYNSGAIERKSFFKRLFEKKYPLAKIPEGMGLSGNHSRKAKAKRRNPMTFTEYQQKALATSSRSPLRLMYAMMGLAAQAGKLCSLHRRAFREHGHLTGDIKLEIQKHCGDAQWYISEIVSVLGYDLDETARLNLERVATLCGQPPAPERKVQI